MWHQLIYKYCMSCHIHPLFLYAGKSEPREKSNAGLAPPTPQLRASNPELPLHLQVASGAWILMLCSTSSAVYINLQKLERVCVSRHKRLEDKTHVRKLLGNYCHGKALLVDCIVVMPWSPVAKVFTGPKHSVDWFLLKLEMGGLGEVLIRRCTLPLTMTYAEQTKFVPAKEWMNHGLFPIWTSYCSVRYTLAGVMTSRVLSR